MADFTALPFADVSTHAPARGATEVFRNCYGDSSFQLTRPRGARHRRNYSTRSEHEFQLTRPRGARLVTQSGAVRTARFQLTRPRGARPRNRKTREKEKRFNSRVREGRDKSIKARIHAPFSFNSRAREGRDIILGRVRFLLMFQLTRPRGARLILVVSTKLLMEVSTHAPARGATVIENTLNAFESFNSRAREGRDSFFRLLFFPFEVSTHAPARGATADANRFYRKDRVSTHAPARGATKFKTLVSEERPVSTHAPARGATGVPQP